MIPFVDKITPDIIQIFKTNDGLWKLWTLTLLANKSTDPLLLKEITRIAEYPTKDEIGEEANLAAIEILNNKNIQSR